MIIEFNSKLLTLKAKYTSNTEIESSIGSQFENNKKNLMTEILLNFESMIQMSFSIHLDNNLV